MDRWLAYLYEEHPEAELRDWASRLKMFRYCRAVGGHANDCDTLEAAFAYSGQSQLVDILNSLGHPARFFDEKPPQPVPGVGYRPEEMGSFPRLINGSAWVEQPGHCEVFGARVFVWCGQGLVTLLVSPCSGSSEAAHSVSAEQVDVAEELERGLSRLSLELVDPPQDDKRCVCPKYYPDFFG